MTLRSRLSAPARWVFQTLGLQRRVDPLADVSPDIAATARRVAPFTMTSPARVVALCEAVEYLTRHHIEGAFVECGVWRGGSSMAAALTALRLGDRQRELWLYDTYEGMPAPTDRDVSIDGRTAAQVLATEAKDDPRSAWCVSPLDEVRRAVLSTGYDAARVHFVAGRVEDTIPASAPERIALLRLDTDWYASTRHELEHLFPRLVPGGVLIIDDYGHWAGARQAVDEYLARCEIPLLLQRIDYTGRLLVKPHA